MIFRGKVIEAGWASKGNVMVLEYIESSLPPLTITIFRLYRIIVKRITGDIGEYRRANRRPRSSNCIYIHLCEDWSLETRLIRAVATDRATVIINRARNAPLLLERALGSEYHFGGFDFLRIQFQLFDNRDIFLLISLPPHLWCSGVEDVHSRPVDSLESGTFA